MGRGGEGEFLVVGADDLPRGPFTVAEPDEMDHRGGSGALRAAIADPDTGVAVGDRTAGHMLDALEAEKASERERGLLGAEVPRLVAAGPVTPLPGPGLVQRGERPQRLMIGQPGRPARPVLPGRGGEPPAPAELPPRAAQDEAVRATRTPSTGTTRTRAPLPRRV